MTSHYDVERDYLAELENSGSDLEVLRGIIEASSQADRLDLAESMIDTIIDQLSICARREQRSEECMSLSILSINMQRYFRDLAERRQAAAES